MPRSAARSTVDEARICHSNPSKQWAAVTVADGLLRLGETLPSGQSFRWINGGPVRWEGRDGALYSEWAGVITDAPVILREPIPVPCAGPATVYLRIDPEEEELSQQRIVEVRDYLRADVDLSHVYEEFCRRDETFRIAHEHHPGARVLRQYPTETLHAFICSSNNNIKRISGMVSHLAEQYGRSVGTYEGRTLYAFPSAENLAKEATEEALRAAGFGYRAKFIASTAKALALRAHREDTTAEEWLLSLRDKSRKEVEDQLTELPGIGQKVAGCIALMSLDKHSVIPVDVHVWNIAKRYMPHLNTKTLTKNVYEQVGNYFRDKFGEENAGLAHNTLFIGELSDFKPRDTKNAKPKTKKKRKSAEDEDELVGKTEPREVKAENIAVKDEAELVDEKKPKKAARRSSRRRRTKGEDTVDRASG